MTLEILDQVRAFARTELIGQEALLDSMAPAPLPHYERFADTGLANWWLSKEYGGLGLSLEDSVRIVSELAYGDAGTAFTLFVPIIATSLIGWYGSDELKERHLGELGRDGGFCATLGSEHAAGSELTLMSTTVRRSGDTLVLNGGKSFSTNTDFARFLVVVCAAPDVPGGYQAVVVPRDTPGITVEKRWDVMGLRSSATYEVTLEDVRVPAGNALAGNGLRLLEIGLNASRILIATSALGIARRVRDVCMEYGAQKKVHGSPLTRNALFVDRLGSFEAEIEVMTNQCLAAARAFDDLAARPDAPEAFLRAGALKSAITAKMFCGRAGWRIASEASEMFGGLGYTHDSVIGKLLRDVRYVSLVEGGDSVLRSMLFSRYVIPPAKRS